MALPKLTTPTYELEIPSTDEKIKYRPFLVKEEKILMMAMESKSSADITQAVKDIVKECTFNKVDISNMPMFDNLLFKVLFRFLMMLIISLAFLWVAWDILILTTFIPAKWSFFKVALSELFGPMVQIILVLVNVITRGY